MVNSNKKNNPICPIKLVSQKQVLSPKAPPHVKSDLLNTNSSNNELNAIITNEFQKYTILQNGAFSLKIGLQCLPDEFENTSNKIKQILLELFASLGIEQEIEFDFSTKIDHVNGNKARKIKRIHNEN